MTAAPRWWKDVNTLREELQQYAARLGFVVRTQGCKIVCTTHNHSPSLVRQLKERKANTPSHKKRNTKSSIVGCGFSLTYKEISKLRGKSGGSRPRLKESPERAVVIIRANYFHSNCCSPSSAQLVMQQLKSGHYQNLIFASQKV